MDSTSEPGSEGLDPDFDNYDPTDWEDVEVEIDDDLGWIVEVDFSAEQARQLFLAIKGGRANVIAFIRGAALDAAVSEAAETRRAAVSSQVD